MRSLTNKETFGLLYLVFGISNLWALINIRYFGGINLVSVGITVITLAATFFFLTTGIYMLKPYERLTSIVNNPQYSWYATSAGFMMYGMGMFLGSGVGIFAGGGTCLRSIPWGIWFTALSILCAYIGYKRISFLSPS